MGKTNGQPRTPRGMRDFGPDEKRQRDWVIDRIRRVFDLTPEGMIAALRLAAPIYRQTAYFGHFGRELPEFTWEKADRVKELEQAG